jgi:hypothetical protein
MEFELFQFCAQDGKNAVFVPCNMNVSCTALQLDRGTCWTEFTVLLCSCICHPNNDLVEVETCGRKMSDKCLLFIVLFVGSKYCTITLLHGM